MYFRINGSRTVVLMSTRDGAPYEDRVEEEGRVLFYEGHDVSKSKEVPDPKRVDQPRVTKSGSLTTNGLFEEAAIRHRDVGTEPEVVYVYEKLKKGIWSYAGAFNLVDAWTRPINGRQVFKFRLEIRDDDGPVEDKTSSEPAAELPHNRMIPGRVKLEVYQRDNGRCVRCGSEENIHFDHILPFSKGGSSLKAENIQLLCARHNLSKGAKLDDD